MNQIALTLSTTTTVASIPNIYDGQRIARLPATFGKKFRITYCSNSSVVDLTEQLFVGNRAEPVHTSAVSVAATTERIVTRDDVVCTFEAEAGEEIIVSVAGAVGEHMSRLIVTPLN